MSSLKRVFSQTLWQVAAKVITSLSSLLIISAVSRQYGPMETGIFTQALTYLSFFYLAVDFGFNAHLLSKLIGESKETTWRQLLGLRIIWSLVLLVIALLLLLVIPIHNLTFDQSVSIAVLAILGAGIFTTSSALFQSKLSYRFATIASLAGSLVTLISILTLVAFHSSVPLLFVGHMVGWLVCGGVSIFLVGKLIPRIKPIFNKDFVITTFKDSWPISLTLLINLIYFRFDSFVLSSVKSFSEVGLYNVAYSVFQTILVIPTYLMNSYYPIMLETMQQRFESFVPQVKKAFFGLLGLGLVAMVGTFILSGVFIQIVTSGKGFIGSVLSLQILSLGIPAFYLSALLMWIFISLKKYKLTTLIYFIGLMINATLNLIFIPRYSYLASSWITGVSEYLILILQLVILFPILKK